jgi:hypothetical protein
VEKRFDRTKQNSRYYRNYGTPTRGPRTTRALSACRKLRRDLGHIHSASWFLFFLSGLAAASLMLALVNALLLNWIPNALIAPLT